jgi:hypothetical protein
MAFLGAPVKGIALAALVTSLVMAVGLAPTVLAQSGVDTVRGSVTDVQGGKVSGAQVTMTNEDTAYSLSQKTDGSGNYVCIRPSATDVAGRGPRQHLSWSQKGVSFLIRSAMHRPVVGR